MIHQVKTVLLLGTLSGIILLIGGLVGGMQGLGFALVLALGMNFVSYFYSDKIVLAMYRAKPLPKAEAQKLHGVIEELARKANIPKPRVYLIPSSNPNAFATGRNPKNAVVAVTSGILQLLTLSELRGVLAHELGHVKNRDILIVTIASTLAAIISYAGMMVRWAAIFGGGRNQEGGSNALELLVMAIIAPLAAVLIQFAISRSREFLADESGARLSGDPAGLASALLKIESASKQAPLRFGSQATASLFIVNPFSARAFVNLFSTHPSTIERVKRLRALRV